MESFRRESEELLVERARIVMAIAALDDCGLHDVAVELAAHIGPIDRRLRVLGALLRAEKLDSHRRESDKEIAPATRSRPIEREARPASLSRA